VGAEDAADRARELLELLGRHLVGGDERAVVAGDDAGEEAALEDADGELVGPEFCVVVDGLRAEAGRSLSANPTRSASGSRSLRR